MTWPTETEWQMPLPIFAGDEGEPLKPPPEGYGVQGAFESPGIPTPEDVSARQLVASFQIICRALDGVSPRQRARLIRSVAILYGLEPPAMELGL